MVGIGEGAGRREARRGILGKRLGEHVVQPGRQARSQALQRWNGRAQVLLQQRIASLRRVDRLAGEEPVGERAEGVDVGRGADGAVPDLLRGASFGAAVEGERRLRRVE